MADMYSFPAFFYCNRCFGRQQRLHNKRLNSRRTSYSSTILATTTLLLLTALRPIAVQAQLPFSTSPYTPRYSAGSSIANNTLYIVSGTTSTVLPYTATSDTLAISLDAPFNTSNIPWIKLQQGYFVQDARVATTVDQKHLVLAGVGDQVGQVVVVFDLVSKTWSYLPATAAANALPQTSRTSVSISLDPGTGQMVLYGGVMATSVGGASATYSLSAEFDFLDTRSTFDKWTWSAAIQSPQPPPGLAQPILLYLPTLGRTLIMGGCSGIGSDGSITQCAPFTTGYIVGSMLMTGSNGTTSSISSISMNGLFPTPRLSPCTAVLASGDVFMYGGVTSSGSLGDAWVLKTSNWTWVPITILNIPVTGRAGATCQLATADQIILIGGFSGALTGPRQFSDQQAAIINTTSWVWSSNFIPGPPTTPPTDPGLSAGAIIGIAVGGCALLGIVFFFVYRSTSKRQHGKPCAQTKAKPFPAIQPSQSMDPLVEDNDDFTNGSESSSTPMVPFNTHFHHKLNSGGKNGLRNDQNSYKDYYQQPSRFATSTSTITSITSGSESGTSRNREREPFLIIPYAPDRGASPPSAWASAFGGVDMSVKSDTLVGGGSVGMRSSELKPGNKMSMDSMSNRGKKGTKTDSDTFKKGDQLPQTIADIQHGQYIKTLQHQKQYEKRRLEESQYPGNAALHRSGTHHTVHRGGHGSSDEDEGPDLATGVIALKDVDFGEEPLRGTLRGVDDGAVLLSSHLDTSKLDSSYL
ncbi:hypothetical protein EDD21DRAFT_390994 [Dissophora ornata]|nr:hypothetical protein BGZ58_000467 [Dissophora ornata]KAI8595529.1 hypothetical protein EDD21DRAFT_390994 [Dissophora ornata]